MFLCSDGGRVEPVQPRGAVGGGGGGGAGESPSDVTRKHIP
jgi:hypothetical protein